MGGNFSTEDEVRRVEAETNDLPERVEIPLSLLKGNMDILLQNKVPCNSIHLIRDPNTANGVLLMIGFASGQKEVAHELGFKTGAP